MFLWHGEAAVLDARGDQLLSSLTRRVHKRAPPPHPVRDLGGGTKSSIRCKSYPVHRRGGQASSKAT